MRHVSLCLPLLLTACAAVPYDAAQVPAPPHTRDNRVALYLGERSLDEDDYEPVEDQTTFGLEFVHEGYDSVVGVEVGLMGSSDEATVLGFDVEGRTNELYVGVHKSFGTAVVKPYVGAGVAYIHSKVEVSGAGSDDDSSPAFYAHAGLTIDVTEGFFLGLDARTLFGSNMTIAGVDTDANYTQFALVLGWAF